MRNQQADLRRRNVSGIRRRVLSNHLAGIYPGQLYVLGGAKLQSALCDSDGGGAVALTDDLRNGYALWAQAQRQPHFPAATN